MKDYDSLVEENQSGKIDDLEFLLAQKDLAVMYIRDLLPRGLTPTPKNAMEWLTRYENEHLYQ